MSESHDAFFLGRIVTMGYNGNKFYNMKMDSALTGEFTIGMSFKF